MPCWQKMLYDVDFRVANVSWLHSALLNVPGMNIIEEKSDGTITAIADSGRVTIDLVNGKISGPEDLVLAVKQSYAKTAINKQVKRLGWDIQWSGTKATVRRVKYG